MNPAYCQIYGQHAVIEYWHQCLQSLKQVRSSDYLLIKFGTFGFNAITCKELFWKYAAKDICANAAAGFCLCKSFFNWSY